MASSSNTISVSGGGISKKKEAAGSSSKPFGDDYFQRLTRLLLIEDEQKAIKELGECVQMVMSAKLTPDQELWDSGDEMGDGKGLGIGAMVRKTGGPERLKAARPAGAAQASGMGSAPSSEGESAVASVKRSFTANSKKEIEPKDKVRKVETLDEKPDTKEYNIESTTNKKCSECKEGASTSNNAILACEGCSTAYHMNCHKPPIPPKDAANDRFLFLCSKCNSKPSTASTSSSRSQSPKPRTDDSKKDDKSMTSKSDKAKVVKSTANITATFEEFKKKKLMKNMKKS